MVPGRRAALALIVIMVSSSAALDAGTRSGARERSWRIALSPPRPVAAVKLVGGEPAGCLHFDVRPQDTRVYVDGRYLGTVDEYDGWPDRLYLPPGRYRLRLNGPEGQAWRGRVEVQAYHQVSVRLLRS